MLELRPQLQLRLREPPALTTRRRGTPTNNEVELPEDLRFDASERKREFLNQLRAQRAANHLEQLPSQECSLHAIMRGNYNAWDLVPGVLKLIAPATLVYLGIATLGFNRRNAAQLVQLLESGRIQQADFICSTMYAKHEPAVCQDMQQSLAKLGSRFSAIRCHAKLMLFQTTAGSYYVYEGSANLRSCRAIEQFCMTNDRSLFNFHRGWMDEMLAKHPFKSDGKKQA